MPSVTSCAKSLLYSSDYQKFGTRWRPSMLLYSKWRRIFVRKRVGSILNLKIHHVNLDVIKLPHSRNVVMESNIVSHLKTINQNQYNLLPEI